MLHVILRIDRVGRSHFTESSAVGKLLRQFRQDVWAATEAKPSDDGSGPLDRLELVMPEGRVVTYESAEHALTRIQKQGEAAGQRENYRLPSSHEARFHVREADDRTWVGLTLSRGAEDAPEGLRHVLRIDALLSRDHRSTGTGETKP